MTQKIENQTIEILNDLEISEFPVPIKKIAKKRGVQIKPYKFEENVSGLLLIKNNVATIGYNPLESTVRQRFTIAHELGHFELHRKESGLFVDKKLFPLQKNLHLPTCLKQPLSLNVYQS